MRQGKSDVRASVRSVWRDIPYVHQDEGLLFQRMQKGEAPCYVR